MLDGGNPSVDFDALINEAVGSAKRFEEGLKATPDLP